MPTKVSECKELMAHWCHERNSALGLDPNILTAGSTTKAWFKCPKTNCEQKCTHYIFQAIGSKRKNPSSCGICAGRFVCQAGCTSVATLRPDIMAQWCHERNTALGLNPHRLMPRSKKKAWFKCPNTNCKKKCTHYNFVSLDRKSQNPSTCNTCAGQQLCEGKCNSVSQQPHLMARWCHDKNSAMGLDPSETLAGSAKKAWFKCLQSNCGCPHISHTKIGQVFRNPNVCSFCSHHKLCEKRCHSVVKMHPYLIKYMTPRTLAMCKTLASGSGRTMVWKCTKGHFQTRSIASFVTNPSCPECKVSSLENRMIDALTNLKISYKREVRFAPPAAYRLDFLVEGYQPNWKRIIRKFAIELDGPQHFVPIHGDEGFRKIQQNDAEKERLLRSQDIRLLRISHDVELSTYEEHVKSFIQDIDTTSRYIITKVGDAYKSENKGKATKRKLSPVTLEDKNNKKQQHNSENRTGSAVVETFVSQSEFSTPNSRQRAMRRSSLFADPYVWADAR